MSEINEYSNTVALVKKLGAQHDEITKPKLMESVFLLSDAINNTVENGNCDKYLDQIKGSVGEIQLALIILCNQLGIDYEQCLYDFYDMVKNR